MITTNPRIHMDLGTAVEVRRFADLFDKEPAETATYLVSGISSDYQGVFIVSLERKTEDDKTEMLFLHFSRKDPQ